MHHTALNLPDTELSSTDDARGPILLNRRAALHQGCLWLTAATASASLLDSLLHAECMAADSVSTRIGLMTDLHHADKSANGSRYYRETLTKLQESNDRLRDEKLAAVVELGDLIDAAETVETELTWLREVDRVFSGLSRQRHYVLGNHCVDTLTKDEFLKTVGQKESYYSFDLGAYRGLILDACFRSDGQSYGRKNSRWNDANIPAAEFDWLKQDLRSQNHPTIVFVHQRLDVENDHGVRNAAAVRKELEAAGHVLAVFQGHSHQNDYREINGIHYCTLRAMVEGTGAENNGYSLLEASPAGLKLTGFRQQKGYQWNRSR